jgi:hypothetical protein
MTFEFISKEDKIIQLKIIQGLIKLICFHNQRPAIKMKPAVGLEKMTHISI